MQCPKCGTKLKTIQTRMRPDGTTYRQKECENGHRYSTLEAIHKFRKVSTRRYELTTLAHMPLNLSSTSGVNHEEVQEV